MDNCYVYYDDFTDCRWNVWLWRTIPIFLILFGTVGNAMNVIILSRKRLQRNPTTVYLLFLAVADLCTLWTTVFPGVLIYGFGQNLSSKSHFTCKSTEYVGYTSGGYSIWLVVLLTIERMMLIRFPVFSRSKLTRRFSFITALTCLAVIVILFVHMPLGREIQVTETDNGNSTVRHIRCFPTKFQTFYKQIWPFFILMFFYLAPITLLVIANCVTIASICLQRKRFCRVNPVGPTHQSNTDKKTKSTSKMILLISAFFIFTTLPYILKRVFEPKIPITDDKEKHARRILSESIFRFVMYCNYTCNFILYCTTGTIFREELKKFVKQAKQQLFKMLSCKEVLFIDAQNNTTVTSVTLTGARIDTGVYTLNESDNRSTCIGTAP